MDAVERIYGPMKALGYVRQEFYDASLTEAEFKRVTDTVTRSLRTVCDYNRGDAHSTSVQVEVDQFRSEKVARAEWASIAYLGTGKESRKLAKREGRGTSNSSPSSRAKTSATWAAIPSRASTVCCSSGAEPTSSASR